MFRNANNLPSEQYLRIQCHDNWINSNWKRDEEKEKKSTVDKMFQLDENNYIWKSERPGTWIDCTESEQFRLNSASDSLHFFFLRNCKIENSCASCALHVIKNRMLDVWDRFGCADAAVAAHRRWRDNISIQGADAHTHTHLIGHVIENDGSVDNAGPKPNMRTILCSWF